MIDAFADVFEGQLQKEPTAGSGGHIHDDPHGRHNAVVSWVADGYAAAHGCLRLHVPGRGFLFGGVQRCPALRVHRQRGVLHRQGISLRKSIALFVPAIPLFFSSFGLMIDCGHAQIRHRFFNDRVGAGHLWHFVSARTGRQSAFKLHFQTADCGRRMTGSMA